MEKLFQWADIYQITRVKMVRIRLPSFPSKSFLFILSNHSGLGIPSDHLDSLAERFLMTFPSLSHLRRGTCSPYVFRLATRSWPCVTDVFLLHRRIGSLLIFWDGVFHHWIAWLGHHWDLSVCLEHPQLYSCVRVTGVQDHSPLLKYIHFLKNFTEYSLIVSCIPHPGPWLLPSLLPTPQLCFLYFVSASRCHPWCLESLNLCRPSVLYCFSEILLSFIFYESYFLEMKS